MVDRKIQPQASLAASPLPFNPLDYSACLLQPHRTSEVRNWQQHIPFAFALMQMLDPRVFVELGAHKGDSYLAFCQVVEALQLSTKCYAVDTWEGDNHAGIYVDSIYTELAAYHDERYAAFSRLVRSTFDEAVSHFADGAIDLLHIDGLHTYDAVRHDFETWLPKLAEHAVVLFHDINVRERDFGVWRLWSELSARYPSFTFPHGNGLGVLAVGSTYPKKLAPLFELDESGVNATRQFFFLLGSRIDSATRLTKGLEEKLAFEAHRSTTRLDILRNTMAAIDVALDATGCPHDVLEEGVDEHAIGRHAVWTHRGLTKLAQDVHDRNMALNSLQAQLEAQRAGLMGRAGQQNDAENKVLELNELVGKLNLEHLRLLDRIASLEQEGSDAKKAITTLDDERARLQQECALRVAEQVESQKLEIIALGDERDRLEQELALRIAEHESAHEKILSDTAKVFSDLDAEISRLQVEQRRLVSRLSALDSHAAGLEQGMRDMRTSWSWRISAPLRMLGKPFGLRLKGGLEQALYRAYYSFPGLSATRKRAFILWLHRNAAFLTRNTLSFRLNQHTQRFVQHQNAASLSKRSGPKATPRMTRAQAESEIATWANPPLISIVMPVYNVEARWLDEAVRSVTSQFYPHWELCIADDASSRKDTKAALDLIEKQRDPRIKVRRSRENVGIARASNIALSLASGAYVGLLDHDDELTHDALFEVAKRIVVDAPDMLYSDEDKINEVNLHVEAHFKPDFSPDYLSSNNYICHFSVIRREILERIGGFRPGFDGAQDYDLILRISEETEKIVHVPMVLYHWRKIAGSTSADSSAKPKTADAGARALTDWAKRRGISATVEAGPYPNTFRVKRALHGEPLVSIIIPFRDNCELLKACVSSILTKSTYANFEVLCVDNGSVEKATLNLKSQLKSRDKRVRFVDYDAPFNYSAINNYAVTQARGSHLLFLNNDTEVLSPGWIEAMLEHSQRPEVGAVGAKLLYADNTIQHAGVIVALGGVAGHAHLYLPGEHPGYFGRAQLVQNLSAVTFACAMMRRDVFEKVGKLNEDDLRIAFNDVDYCLRVREAGYLIVYTPYAVLHHYESKSRGFEDTPEKQKRFGSEVEYMQKRYAGVLAGGDPYYNPNLSLIAGPSSFQPDLNYIDQLP